MELVCQEQIFAVIFSTVLFVHLLVCLPQVRGIPRYRTSLGICFSFRVWVRIFIWYVDREDGRMQLDLI